VIKQAHEVYSLTGSGWTKRQIHGYAWTYDGAKAIADKVEKRVAHIGVVHLIEVNGRLHKINVIPVDKVDGDIEQAEVSRIELNDIPTKTVPAVYVHVQGTRPRRLGNDLERALNFLGMQDRKMRCKLYTLRTRGLTPIEFLLDDLHEDPKVQESVYRWIEHEMEARK
jgi:hypothetical protein